MEKIEKYRNYDDRDDYVFLFCYKDGLYQIWWLSGSKREYLTLCENNHHKPSLAHTYFRLRESDSTAGNQAVRVILSRSAVHIIFTCSREPPIQCAWPPSRASYLQQAAKKALLKIIL